MCATKTTHSTHSPSLEAPMSKQDVYSRVNDRIIADLEHGVRPWMKPWSACNAEGRISIPKRHNGEPYKGINVLLLWGEAMDKGYSADRWMTYIQASDLKAQVRKGERGSMVVYADSFKKKDVNDAGDEVEQDIPFLKAYTVFNVEQIDGLPNHYYSKPLPKGEPVQLIEQAELYFAASGAVFRHLGSRAYYSIGYDRIQLPVPESFRDAESYAATKAHELAHWSGHPSRLCRQFGKRFGDDAYSFEELVAEIASAYLCADLSISPEVREDHASYLAHWLSVLRRDKRAILAAASHAQKAVDYLNSLQS
jgi:antirestriction protein ArdC